MNIQKLKSRPYNTDQTLLKIYGSKDKKKIKLIRMNYLRVAGVETEENKLRVLNNRCMVNDEKTDENILRSKEKIFELAYCNCWDWFFTGTIDPRKFDRTDLDSYHKKLTQWIRDYNKKHNLNIKFLFVPELHKDGKSWHIHGFISGLPVEHLKQFTMSDKMSLTLLEKVKNGDLIYNWLAYYKTFGFCDLEPIRNHEAVCKYVTKYINKDLANSVKKLNAHTYYHSRGLKFAEVKKIGSMDWSSIEPTFVNDYCSVCWLDYTDETYNFLIKRFI